MKKKINKQTYGRGPYNYKERWNKWSRQVKRCSLCVKNNNWMCKGESTNTRLTGEQKLQFIMKVLILGYD